MITDHDEHKLPKPRSYYEFQINDTPIKTKSVLRGVWVCLARSSIALDFSAAACETNITLLVSKTNITTLAKKIN